MVPWILLAETRVGIAGKRLSLFQRDAEFSIRLGGTIELMNSRNHHSEDALAELACTRLPARTNTQVLIGGLGMGYTLAAALRHLTADAQVTVAELVPEVVAWNRGPLAGLAGHPLTDARVCIRETDVANILRSHVHTYDAILLDVDNGPEGLTQRDNNWLYGDDGLAAAYTALRPGGILAVWSATRVPIFTQRLHKAGFLVEEVGVRAHAGKGSRHVIWLAGTHEI